MAVLWSLSRVSLRKIDDGEANTQSGKDVFEYDSSWDPVKNAFNTILDLHPNSWRIMRSLDTDEEYNQSGPRSDSPGATDIEPLWILMYHIACKRGGNRAKIISPISSDTFVALCAEVQHRVSAAGSAPGSREYGSRREAMDILVTLLLEVVERVETLSALPPGLTGLVTKWIKARSTQNLFCVEIPMPDDSGRLRGEEDETCNNKGDRIRLTVSHRHTFYFIALAFGLDYGAAAEAGLHEASESLIAELGDLTDSSLSEWVGKARAVYRIEVTGGESAETSEDPSQE